MELKQAKLLVNELKEESMNTLRILERVPEDKLGWSPHPKSMTLGQLALHIAVLPGAIAELLGERMREVPIVPLPEAATHAEIIAAHTNSVAKAEEMLSSWGDEGLEAEWTMTSDGQIVMSVPRTAMIRSIMLNHWYHHRGQLVVYLRLLDMPIPAIYGPSADEL